MATKIDADSITAFTRFSQNQGGTMPPALARQFLQLTNSGLWSAAKRGALYYFQVGTVRYYGIKSLKDYKYFYSRKFDGSCPPQHKRQAKWNRMCNGLDPLPLDDDSE